jgi:RNA polymerase sigma-70 factor (ECF subfamily)
MADAPLTRASLLMRIRDPRDSEAWQQFVRLYAPLIYGYARKRGLQDADAGDLTQEVLRSVAAKADRFEYDPRRGTFHGWLFTVVRNRVLDFLDSRGQRHRGSGDSGVQKKLEAQPAPDNEQTDWNRDYEQRLLSEAIVQVRGDFHEATWQAFWQTAIEGRKAKVVAESLAMSVASVYVAKSRVLTQLKECIRSLQATDRWENEAANFRPQHSSGPIHDRSAYEQQHPMP